MEKNITIYLVLFFTSFVIFFAGVIILFIQYRNKQKITTQEKELMQQQHQQQLLATQLEMQQQTMQQIGQEIHDNVGQKLTLASLYTQQLQLANSGENSTKVNYIKSIIDESLQELRSLSKSLTNNDIAIKSIKELIEAEVEKIKETNKFIIESNLSEVAITNTITKTILLRIVQEFFQNTIKHAEAKHIKITLQQSENNLLLYLQDDGIGFVAGGKRNGIGLQNIEKRAAAIESSVKIESSLNHGVSLTLTIPNHKLV